MRVRRDAAHLGTDKLEGFRRRIRTYRSCAGRNFRRQIEAAGTAGSLSWERALMTGLELDAGVDDAPPPTADDRHLPGEEGVWVLIFGDMIIFGAFFITFMIYRAQNLAVFNAGRNSLDVTIGLSNTLILLTSSLLVAQAVHMYRRGQAITAGRLLIGAIACGATFLTLKAFEYHDKVSMDITLNSSEFFIFYYTLTGIHALHVIIGLGVLTYLARTCFIRRDSVPASKAMEAGASFWHLVDLLWIVIFPLLYLVF